MNDPTVHRALTSSSFSVIIVAVTLIALFLAATALSGKIESLAVIAATAVHALMAALRGLIIILLTMLLVLVIALYGSDDSARSDNLPPPRISPRVTTGSGVSPPVG